MLSALKRSLSKSPGQCRIMNFIQLGERGGAAQWSSACSEGGAFCLHLRFNLQAYLTTTTCPLAKDFPRDNSQWDSLQ